jgi:glutathione S-transferase
MFELYHNNMSVCSQRVRLVLREKDLSFKEHHLDLRAGDSMTPDYLKLNPNGVVPTLIDNGEPIVESAVICEYIDEVAPTPALRPSSAIGRARMRVWAKIPDEGLHAACAVISNAIAFRHQYLAMPREEMERNLANTPDPARRERKRQGIEQGLDAPFVPPAVKLHERILSKMETQLASSRWLAGDEFSLADIALIPYIQRLEHLSQGWMWRESLPAVTRWFEACKARSSYGAIKDYLVANAVTLMSAKGREAQARFRSIIGK